MNCDDVNCDIEYLLIINQKLKGGDNYLHFLVSQMTEENGNEISEMIKILLINGCDPNTLNDRHETPFYLLLENSETSKIQSDLMNFICTHSSIDFHSHNDIVNLMQQRGCNNVTMCAKPVKDIDFMINLIKQWNEMKFIDEFNNFINFHVKLDLALLLDQAVVRNLWRIVEVIVKNGVDVNRNSNAFKLPPVFLACKFGHFEVLKVLLSDEKLKFNNQKQSLLQLMLENEKIDTNDRHKCFDLVVADRRCTSEIINGLDVEHQPPLFYACHYRFDEIAIELLKRGAFIGHESVINIIDKDVLKKFLDENIKCSGNIEGKNCEVHIDYRFLKDEKSKQEVRSLSLITENSEIKQMILHPVISSFLQLKWKKIDFIVYFNLLVYFCFMMFLGSFVVVLFYDDKEPTYSKDAPKEESACTPANRVPFLASYHPGYADEAVIRSEVTEPASVPAFLPKSPPSLPVPASGSLESKSLFSLLFTFGPLPKNKRRKRSTEKDSSFKFHYYDNINFVRICAFGIFLIAIYEFVQCVTSFKSYFFKFANWLDLFMI